VGIHEICTHPRLPCGTSKTAVQEVARCGNMQHRRAHQTSCQTALRDKPTRRIMPNDKPAPLPHERPRPSAPTTSRAEPVLSPQPFSNKSVAALRSRVRRRLLLCDTQLRLPSRRRPKSPAFWVIEHKLRHLLRFVFRKSRRPGLVLPSGLPPSEPPGRKRRSPGARKFSIRGLRRRPNRPFARP